MLSPVPAYPVRAMQDTIQLLGKPVQFIAAGGAALTVRARVVYLSSGELANSIEMYPIRVTLDARDFSTRAPAKGDTLVIDDARRAIMSVTESHFGDTLVKYVCGVAG